MRQIGKGVRKKGETERERVKHWETEGSQEKGLRLGLGEDEPD